MTVWGSISAEGVKVTPSVVLGYGDQALEQFGGKRSAFDLLNRRINISQYGSQNFVSRSIAPTLARYFMLSVTYNMRGYENKISKNNWW